ncbi:MAG: hypothetical protein JWM35_1676 [Verrucomicrobia bacterium]|nr:hypothetical protein [Verrucomicrobiota bacterium]
MTSTPPHSGARKFSLPLITSGWNRAREFAGFAGGATYLWPRWFVLRAVGVVFVLIFAGIIDDSAALVGPHGLAPLPSLIAQLRAGYPSGLEAFFHAPSLFWINAGPGMILFVEWCGLAAAVALVLNLWPRMALFACWLSLLSFANGWIVFSDPLVDWLMLEVGLLCIPFAPAGYRPGLGVHSPPRPIAVFMMRWLLFRVMFECGLSKLINADPRWGNLTAMDDLYEVAPCPTILGYYAHQLPHAWHVLEIGLTFLAEFVAPLVAMFGGRRGRWCAFWCWSAFQIGIQLTCNYGWLNTSSFALGFVLLDDQMLVSAAEFLRLRKVAAFFASAARRAVFPALAPWRRHALGAALWLHFYLTLIFFATASNVSLGPVVDGVSRPMRFLFQGFGSVNSYTLYAWLDPLHWVVEFVGSNDGGQTWRSYDYKYFPQQADRMPPFIAPRFPRFEATLHIEVATRDKPATLFGIVARQLLARNPQVMGLFERDPFPDRPAQMIRTPGYRFRFTDLATFRETRNFWHKDYIGEFMPMKYMNSSGEVVEAATTLDQISVKAEYGNPEAQSYLGLIYISGDEGVEKDSAEAAKWFRKAAEQGVAGAQLNLALIYSTGDGLPANPVEAAHWCRLAAEGGLAEAQDRLGVMYIQGEGLPRDETEALVWFDVAVLSGNAEATKHKAISEIRMLPSAKLAAEQRSKVIFAEIEARKKK